MFLTILTVFDSVCWKVIIFQCLSWNLVLNFFLIRFLLFEIRIYSLKILSMIDMFKLDIIVKYFYPTLNFVLIFLEKIFGEASEVWDTAKLINLLDCGLGLKKAIAFLNFNRIFLYISILQHFFCVCLIIEMYIISYLYIIGLSFSVGWKLIKKSLFFNGISSTEILFYF